MIDDDRLDAILRSVGDHLGTPDPADLDLDLTGAAEAVPGTTSRAARRHRRRPRTGPMSSRGLVAVAAAAAVTIGGILLVPPARSAVADLLGLGSTRISVVGGTVDPGGLPDLSHLAGSLEPVTAEQAATLLGGSLPDTSGTSLGPPDRILRVPEGGVLLAWSEASATLWIRDGEDTEILFTKLTASTDDLEPVEELGTEAMVVRGTHLLDTPHRRLAAGTVLLWLDDGRELRLEADLDTPELVAVARALQ